MFDRVVSEDPFLILNYPDKYMTQKMHDKAVDVSLTTLKLIPDWAVASKMIKKLFTDLYANDNLMRILVMSYFLIMKWVFLIYILIILILIIILMKVILILLFFSDLWLGILNLKNVKYLKNDK